MQFPSRYALLVLGPISVWSVGCSAITHRPVAHAGPSISNTDRLLSMAQVYEQKGQLQQAHKFYCQVLQENPNHPVAREHATDLMAAISNAQSAKDPAASQQVAEATRTPASGLSVSTVPRAPVDPALVGSQGRKILTDDEVAARIPKPRSVAAASPVPQPRVATVTHEETRTGPVTTAEQIDEQPAASPAIVIEQPITVVEAPGPIEAPQPIELPAVQPLVIDAPGQIVTSAGQEPEPLPLIVSNKATIVVAAAPTATWVKTSIARLCPAAPEHLQTHLANLDAADPEARKAALEELANCGPDATTCLPAVRACLADADPLVQAHAAWALWTISGESAEAVRCLSAVLDGDQEAAIVFSCYVLGSMGPQAQSAAVTLARLQDDDSTTIRVHASEAMLKIQPSSTTPVQVLKASLASHRAEERCLAAVALGAASGAERRAAVSALIAALYDVDSGVRCSAALALGGFGPDASTAISALEVAASATDLETRDAATTALACIRK